MPKCMIVLSPYYMDVAGFLLQGCTTFLNQNKIDYDLFEVPGALEIPAAVKMGIEMRIEDKYDIFVALGCVIRGETSHYDIVCNESARGLSQLMMEYGAHIGNGILTCDTHQQAIVRADPDQKNKGAAAADAALSLYQLERQLS